MCCSPHEPSDTRGHARQGRSRISSVLLATHQDEINAEGPCEGPSALPLEFAELRRLRGLVLIVPVTATTVAVAVAIASVAVAIAGLDSGEPGPGARRNLHRDP